MKLIDDWRREVMRLWTIRWSIAVAILTGLGLVWFAFEGVVPLWAFAAIGIAAPVLNVVIRLLKQPPGVDE